MALEVGSRIAHYDVTALIGVIGEGGMGRVDQATDTKLNRQVADSSCDLFGGRRLKMRAIAGMFLASVFLTSIAWPQGIEPALQEAMTAREAARVGGDAYAWGRLTTDDFMAINADGVLTKAQRMAAIERGEGTGATRTTEENVRQHGDTAIMTQRWESGVRYTEVWVKANDRWLVANVQFTPPGP